MSQEQIDTLPSALRTEAMNFRRGGGGGLFGGPPHHHGNMPRPPRNLEQMMGGPPRHERDELERQMDLVVNRIRRDGGPLDGEYHKKLPDPKEIAFD